MFLTALKKGMENAGLKIRVFFLLFRKFFSSIKQHGSRHC